MNFRALSLPALLALATLPGIALAFAVCTLVGLASTDAQADSTPAANDASALLGEATESISEGLGTLSPSSSLLDAWAIVERYASPQWAYSFVQKKPADSDASERLKLDLESLALEAHLSGRNTLAQGLSQWGQTLATLPQGRIPGRFTPTWLMNHLRDMPPLEDLALLGWCQPPRWVEVWSALGVTHHLWQPGMTTDTLLQALPERAYGGSDYASVITPFGEIQQLGIAAWNFQSTPLAPGSRIVTRLPLRSTAAEWLNTELPRFLSTRVPGTDCVTLPLP